MANADMRRKLAMMLGDCPVTIKGMPPIITARRRLISLKAFGGTEQNGTPTPDAPVDIVSNNGVVKYTANIANVNAQTVLIGYYISASGVVTVSNVNWIYQDYIPVSPGTTYTLSISSPVYFMSISEYSIADDSGFIIRNASAFGQQTSLTITTGQTTNYIKFGANIDQTPFTLEEVLAIDWMLNKGQQMPYQPYSSTRVYADGTVETINVHSKNLFDKNMPGVLIGGFPTNTGAFSSSSGFRTVIYPLQIGKTYTITRVTSTSTSAAMRVVAYNTQQPQSTSNGVVLSIGTVSSKAATITVPEGYPYVATYVMHSNDTISDTELLDGFQIELGSTATEYQPYYDGGIATAEMLLKVGDYQDVQSVLDGVVTRNVGVKVLDGTESITAASDNYYFAYTITDKASGLISSVPLPISTHFKTASTTGTNNIPDNGIGASSVTSNKVIWFKMSAAQDTDAFKQFLADQYAAGTPVIVVYPLATPVTEQVAGQTLALTSGTNVIDITQASLNNLELEVKAK
jgi:hypothetical protein